MLKLKKTPKVNRASTTQTQRSYQTKTNSRAVKPRLNNNRTPSSSLTTPSKAFSTTTQTEKHSISSTKERPHRVLIVGGGASGLALATSLGKQFKNSSEAEVMLVSNSLTHTWKPLYHELAVGSMNSYEDEVGYWGHGSRHGFSFVAGSLERIDPDQKHVHLEAIHQWNRQSRDKKHLHTAIVTDEILAPKRFLEYDTLVLSIGSKCNDFGTPGASDHTIFLDTREAADEFHSRLLGHYLRAQAINIVEHHGNNLTQPIKESGQIVAVGGGLTGVELLSELAWVLDTAKKYKLNSVDPSQVGLVLVEAGPRILPALDEGLAQQVHAQLTASNIKVMTKTKVVSVTKNEMICEQDGKEIKLPFDLAAWCAGIKADESLQQTGLEINRLNQVKVGKTLQTTNYPSIFAMGDCSTYQPPGAKAPLPASAQVAHQQATFLAKVIPKFIKNNKADLGEFEFTDKGVLVSIGKTAIGKIFGKYEVRSIIAGLMYYSMYRFHQFDLHGHRAWWWIWRDVINYFKKPSIKLH